MTGDPAASIRLILATHNTGKLAELRNILAGVLPAQAIASSLDLHLGDVPETGVTFAENALIKARAVAAATGTAAVGDDSGIAVDILGGAPGIFSARWAGRHGDDRANCELLLAQLADIAPEHRRASFVCAAALVTPDGQEFVEHGYLRGTLTTTPRGNGGFGYDPILMPEGSGLTTAEIGAETKNAISHRGQAFRALVPTLQRLLG